MITWAVIHLIALFSGLGVVYLIRANGGLGGGLSRAFVGGSVTIFSKGILGGWYSVESFVTACFNGNLGLSGYFFILGLFSLIYVWGFNFITTRRVVIQ